MQYFLPPYEEKKFYEFDFSNLTAEQEAEKIKLNYEGEIELASGANTLTVGEYHDEYSDRNIHKIEICFRDMLLEVPKVEIYLDHAEEEKISPQQDNTVMNQNSATWYFERTAFGDLKEGFLCIAPEDHTAISHIIVGFADGSVYTMTNKSYAPVVNIENTDDYNTGEYVYITTVTLDAEKNWSEKLEDFPATDGRGNAYEYYIKEINVAGVSAYQYELIGYENNGIMLAMSNNEVTVKNGRTDRVDVLPQTGGEGYRNYIIIGISLIIFGIAGYGVFRYRMLTKK